MGHGIQRPFGGVVSLTQAFEGQCSLFDDGVIRQGNAGQIKPYHEPVGGFIGVVHNQLI